MSAEVQLTPDCGPHCKVKVGRVIIFDLRSITLKHCRCKKCHGKPVPSR